MSARVVQMLEAYRRLHRKTGKAQPLMKLASFLSAKEVMAAAEFGCHSATVSTKLIDELARLTYDPATQPDGGRGGAPKPAAGIEHYAAARPESARLRKLLASVDPKTAAELDGTIAEDVVDYLANGGEALRRAIEADALTKTRLADALEAFTGAEEKSRAKIESVVAAL